MYCTVYTAKQYNVLEYNVLAEHPYLCVSDFSFPTRKPTIMASAKEQSLPGFLRLPLELRNTIYALCLHEESVHLEVGFPLLPYVKCINKATGPHAVAFCDRQILSEYKQECRFQKKAIELVINFANFSRDNTGSLIYPGPRFGDEVIMEEISNVSLLLAVNARTTAQLRRTETITRTLRSKVLMNPHHDAILRALDFVQHTTMARTCRTLTIRINDEKSEKDGAMKQFLTDSLDGSHLPGIEAVTAYVSSGRKLGVCGSWQTIELNKAERADGTTFWLDRKNAAPYCEERERLDSIRRRSMTIIKDLMKVRRETRMREVEIRKAKMNNLRLK